MAKYTHSIFSIVFISALFNKISSKSIIDPCSTSDSCPAIVRYILSDRHKVSEIAARFQVDYLSLLAANAIDISYPGLTNHIFPPNLTLKVPVNCTCVDGIRKSVISYTVRTSDTLASIVKDVYSGLVSVDQIASANRMSTSTSLSAGQNLNIPLPCTCFNLTDNGQPSLYLSYVVKSETKVSEIAAEYFTTVSDVKSVNGIDADEVEAGDTLAIPLPACASSFDEFAADRDLFVPNGSYTLTASDCVQCSCGPGNLKLNCGPAPLEVPCPSMQCRNSNLMLGNITYVPTSGGCNVTSCSYDGFVNGTIATKLSEYLQPLCSGPQKVPPLIAPPTVIVESTTGPAPSPTQHAGGNTRARTIDQRRPIVAGVGPAPSGIVSGLSSFARQLNPGVLPVYLCVMGML